MKGVLLAVVVICISLCAAKAMEQDGVEVWMKSSLQPADKSEDIDIILQNDHSRKLATIPSDQFIKIKIAPLDLKSGVRVGCLRKSDQKQLGAEHFEPIPNLHYLITADFSINKKEYGRTTQHEGCKIQIERALTMEQDGVEVWMKSSLQPADKSEDIDIILQNDHSHKLATIPSDQFIKIKIAPLDSKNGVRVGCLRKSDQKQLGAEHFEPIPNSHYLITADFSINKKEYGRTTQHEGCEIQIERALTNK